MRVPAQIEFGQITVDKYCGGVKMMGPKEVIVLPGNSFGAGLSQAVLSTEEQPRPTVFLYRGGNYGYRKKSLLTNDGRMAKER